MDRSATGPLTVSGARHPVRTAGSGEPERSCCCTASRRPARPGTGSTPTLTAAGYRVLAPDQRGYAPGALAKGRRAYRMSELVCDVVALLDAAGSGAGACGGPRLGRRRRVGGRRGAPERLLSLTALSTPHPAAMVRATLTEHPGAEVLVHAGFQLPWLPERLLDPSRPGRPQAAGRARCVASGQERAAAERDADALAEPGRASRVR